MTSLGYLLLLLHVLFQVSAVLLPPKNLKFVSENFRHILTWDDPNNVSGIYYKVDCLETGSQLVHCKSCFNITTRRCDLTKYFTVIQSEYTARVSSCTDHEVSNWTNWTSGITPILDTNLGPPIVDVRPCDHCIEVYIHPPMSYLWDEETQSSVAMDSDDVYSLLKYTVYLKDSKQSLHSIHTYDIRNATVFSKLLPNANYCVSVKVESSTNLATPIPSASQCVTTGPKDISKSNMHYVLPAVFGVLLFLGLLLLLISLDRAGYIGLRRKLFPKMLKSLPQTESMYSRNDECTSPTYIVPVEIISPKLDVEENHGKEEKHKEGGYACRKKLLDSDTSGGDSSGPILSSNSSSGESSGQMTGSSGEERIPAERLISLATNTDSSGSSNALIPVNTSDSSSDHPFNNGVFNVNLSSICFQNSVDSMVGLKHVDSFKEEPDREPETNSGQSELSFDGEINICTSNILVDLKPTETEYNSDNCEEDLKDKSDQVEPDDHVVSGYMSR